MYCSIVYSTTASNRWHHNQTLAPRLVLGRGSFSGIRIANMAEVGNGAYPGRGYLHSNGVSSSTPFPEVCM